MREWRDRMEAVWTQGNLVCKADDGLLTVQLGKVSFGVELRSEAAKAVHQFAHFIVAAKMSDQDVIELINVLEGNTDDAR